ncbi:hypothetical protein TSUD_333050 [Trifolium subterraneum]|uniref:CSC1/OSCA1-like 7TM region domain-containing protein n=1 Tax=Trifolium subterraneum TaxID=3900 RepID=A0A2Z6NIK5_TRISU|nr:hypothetical protein TSUD_333050 [Trifolium subterraneum]
MATLADIGISATINLSSAIMFLLAFAVLRLQPFNDRVYFPKWYLKGIRGSPTNSRSAVKNFVNLDSGTYIRFLNWMPAALHMPEPELIDHAGLDSTVFIRIYMLGVKIFAPITLLAFMVLVPINWFGKTLEAPAAKDLTFSDIDKLSISNVPLGSKRFWAHIGMSYVFSAWTCYSLYKEYMIIASMRLRFLASERRRPDQFTVLVRNVPPDMDESVSMMGLLGAKVDAINHYTALIDKLSEEEAKEREKVTNDPNSIMPAAFVSFRTRWGAAVCAQTQQTSDPTVWLTEWAPEPRDVYWENLAIPYFDLNLRRLITNVSMFFLTFFFMIPIAFVQSLANIEAIEKVFPFLKSVIEKPSVKSVIQGFLPGLALKIFLIMLPKLIMAMSKMEGYTSFSGLERRSASKYYLFVLVNVFLGSIDAMVKDTLERAVEPTLNLRLYLQDAYVHPVFKGGEFGKTAVIDDEEENPLIQTKRACRGSKPESDNEAASTTGSC